MCDRKVNRNLFHAVIAAVVCISDGRAATLSSLSNKTYNLIFNDSSLRGYNAKYRLYIDAAGRIFQYGNDQDHDLRASAGSFTKLNASNHGQFTCPDDQRFAGFVFSYVARAKLSGSTITYEANYDARSTTGASLPFRNFRFVFGTDGARCDAISLSVNNQSFPPVSCEVSAGRT